MRHYFLQTMEHSATPLFFFALLLFLLLARVGDAATNTSPSPTPSGSPSPTPTSPSPSPSPSSSPSPPSTSVSPSATTAPPTPTPSPNPGPNLPICNGYDQSGNPIPYTSIQPPPGTAVWPTPTPAPTPGPCQCYYLDPVTGQPKPSPTGSKECRPPRPEIKQKKCVTTKEGSYDSHKCDDSCNLVAEKVARYVSCPEDANNCPASYSGATFGYDVTACTRCKYKDDAGQWQTKCQAETKSVDVTVTVSCAVQDVVVQYADPGQDGLAGADPGSCFLRNGPGIPPNTCSPGTCSWATKSAASNCTQITNYPGSCEFVQQPPGGGGTQLPPGSGSGVNSRASRSAAQSPKQAGQKSKMSLN